MLLCHYAKIAKRKDIKIILCKGAKKSVHQTSLTFFSERRNRQNNNYKA